MIRKKSEENRGQPLVGKFVKIERNVDPVLRSNGREIIIKERERERCIGLLIL
jgi:hypothetical protein